MKRVRIGLTAVVAAATMLVVTQPAIASQLNLLPMLQISGQYSDNVFFTENNKDSDTFFLVNPGVALDYASSRFVGSLAYQVGLQRYVDFDERDNDVHRLDANLGINLARGFYLDVSDNLYITNDPLAFDASGDRLQRDSFTYNRIVPAVSYIFSNNAVRLSARYDRTDIDYDTLIDSYQNAFGFNASVKAGDRSSVGFDYFEFRRSFDEQAPEFNVVDYTGRRYGGRVERRFSPRLAGNLFVGYEERQFEPSTPTLEDFDSVIFEGQLNGELPEVFSWAFGFSQRLNDLAVSGAYKVQRITFDVRKSLMDRMRMEFNGYYQDSENDQIPEQAQYFGFRVEGQYLVAKFLNAWLGYTYTDRDSDDISPYTENRINFGLTLSYGI